MTKKRLLLSTVVSFFILSCVSWTMAFDEFPIWPELPPGEKEGSTPPHIELWQPKDKTSDACIIIAPGGAYMGVAYEQEGAGTAQYFYDKGITIVMLWYRVPRREGWPKHLAA